MNAHHTFTISRTDPATWEPRYRAALNTAGEAGAFMQLSAEMEGADEPLWALFYDLATDNIDRTEALAEVDETFARYAAEDAYDHAAYAYEVRTGLSCDDAGSPYWDRAAWVAERSVRA